MQLGDGSADRFDRVRAIPALHPLRCDRAARRCPSTQAGVPSDSVTVLAEQAANGKAQSRAGVMIGLELMSISPSCPLPRRLLVPGAEYSGRAPVRLTNNAENPPAHGCHKRTPDNSKSLIRKPPLFAFTGLSSSPNIGLNAMSLAHLLRCLHARCRQCLSPWESKPVCRFPQLWRSVKEMLSNWVSRWQPRIRCGIHRALINLPVRRR